MLRHLPEFLKERLRRRTGAITEYSRLQNLQRIGFSPRHILDGGAYLGHWSATARTLWPAAKLVLVEPQPALRDALQHHCTGLGRAEFVSAALGATSGSTHLLLEASNSRCAVCSPRFIIIGQSQFFVSHAHPVCL